jgi:hypothetical protein
MFINPETMHLHIAPNRLISDIQKEFNENFPFLKIEFFKTKSFSRSEFMAHQIIPSQRKIGESQQSITDGDIEIEADMKVKDLEKIFKDQFSLAMQVFRKSGNLWLETTMTDGWTLQQQNDHGYEISTGKKNIERPDDFDLNRDAGH